MVTYQFGPAGTDRHAPTSEVEWGEPYQRECRVCMGMGFGKVGKYPDTTSGMHIRFDEFGGPHRTPLKDWRTMNERRKQTNDLMNLAMLLGPEGEDIDVTDLNLTLRDIIEISNTLGRLRKAGEVVKRSLAQAWHENHAGEAAEYGDQEYYLGYASKKVFQEGQSIEFARWLKKQDIDTIEKIVGISGIRMTPLGKPDSPIRATFFDEVKTSEDLRIQSRPTR